MKFTAFVPAVLALSFFSAAQASSSLERRSHPNVDAVVALIVNAHVKAAAEVCAKITADVCADVDLTVEANVNALGGIVTAKVDVDKVRVSAKARVDADIKAKIDADVKAIVIAPIAGIVDKTIRNRCPDFDSACIRRHAKDIVALVNAQVDVKINKLRAALKVDIPAHIRARVKVIIPEICVHLGIAEAAIRARLYIAANINVHIKACVKLWAKIWAKVNLVALITRAL
ncbi:hypothetical protein BGZ46_010445 [Entomortierella lignicola]|nr:hypothetical protein BGZ46_010445 [Entomortierella lignicola]